VGITSLRFKINAPNQCLKKKIRDLLATQQKGRTWEVTAGSTAAHGSTECVTDNKN